MKFVFSKDLIIDSEKEPFKREGLRVGIYGAPGSTKSYTAAAFLVEPFLHQGGTIVLFQPRAEWHTLKDKFPDVQVVGGSYNQDVPFSASHPKLYADAVIEQGVSMIFYTPDVDEEEKLIGFVDRFLYYVMKGQEVTHRPLMVVLEEAHEYAPRTPSGRVAPPWVFNRMVKRCADMWTGGRKLNIVSVAITQRPQELHFGIRQLCNLSLYGQFAPQDLSYIDKECLSHYRKEGMKIDAGQLKDLAAGRFLVIHHGQAYYEQRTVERITPHGADTPSLTYVPSASEGVTKTISDLGVKLKELLEKQALEESELEKTKRKTRELEKTVEELKKKADIAGVLREGFQKGSEKGTEKGMAKDFPEPQVVSDKDYIKKLEDKEHSLLTANKLLSENIEKDMQRIWELEGRIKAAQDALGLAAPITLSTSADSPNSDIVKGLPNYERKIYDYLSKHHGIPFTRYQISTAAGIGVKSSRYSEALRRLKTLKLIEEAKEGLRCVRG